MSHSDELLRQLTDAVEDCLTENDCYGGCTQSSPTWAALREALDAIQSTDDQH